MEQSRDRSRGAASSASSTPEIVFGPVLKRMRKARGMTQSKLASKAGLTPAYIWLLEAGRKQPSIATLVKLAKAFDLPASDLLAEVLRYERGAVARRRRRPDSRA